MESESTIPPPCDIENLREQATSIACFLKAQDDILGMNICRIFCEGGYFSKLDEVVVQH